MNPLDLFLGGATASGVIFTAIGIVKRVKPSLVEGREKFVALALGVLLGIAAYVHNPESFGGKGTLKGWSMAVSLGVAAALGSQALHDKNPLRTPSFDLEDGDDVEQEDLGGKPVAPAVEVGTRSPSELRPAGTENAGSGEGPKGGTDGQGS